MANYSLLTKSEIEQYEIASPEYDEAKHSFTSDDSEAVITCVGDCLVEEKMYKSHLFGKRFSFDDVFMFVKSYFLSSDLSIANLETMICENAPYTGEQHKIGGKYFCNAPVEFLQAVKNAGINFLMLSNNHNLDCGVNGIIETLNRINKLGFGHTGLFVPQDTKRYSIVEIKGIKIALAAYSTWFNRNKTRLTELGRKTFINEYSKEKVSEDIRAAKQDGAEFVLVYIHWGTDAEYKTQPSESMKRMAQEIADSGADYIVGSHTHSVQPFAEITAANGMKVPCIYSMGIFVTSEISKISRQTAILQLKLKKNHGVVQVVEQRFIPCYIPDAFYNISYPVLPKGMGTANNFSISSFNNDTLKTLGCETTHFGYKLTKKRVCSILGLPLPEDDEEYTSVRFARDSQKGCVAIISEISFDSDYVTPPQRCVELAKVAIEKGAKLLIVKTEIEGYPCLVVDNVFGAFCRIMRSVRSFYSPKTVGITGSVGKTSTMQMVYSVLRSKNSAHISTDNANDIRLSGYVIQGLDSKHEVYVQEIMEGPPYGAAEVISKMVQPDAAIVTVVGSSHMEVFGSKERILESCLGIQEGMPENGLLILNGDDPFQKNAVVEKKAVYYGIDDETADYRAINIKTNDTSIAFDIIHEGDTTHIVLNCFGRHNVLNALAAFAAGKWAGMANEEISAALFKYRTSGIRQNLVKFGGYRIFLDCYNAAVESMKTALEQLGEMPVIASGKHIAVLADIAESGDMAVDYHKQVGTIAAASCADIVICYGDNARYIAEEAQKSKKTYYTDSRDELMEIIKENVTTDDVILFKGSHGMKLEQIVDNIWGTWFHEVFEILDYHTTKNTFDNYLSYRIYTDHVSVINKTSAESDIVIPDFVENLPVRSISPNAFSADQSIRHIKLPENLVNIRYCAFYNSMLEGEIVIPSSVRIIHDSAFGRSKLQQVIINDGCTHLGYRAFGNCTELKSIRIPKTVLQIGNEAFINCKQLTIYGKAGSYAEAYAEKNKIEFIEEKMKITKERICSILGLPKPKCDDEYTSVRFAQDSTKDCVAVVISTQADPNTEATSPQQRIELAREAIEKGAKLLIVKTEIDGYPCLVVDNVFDAYCRIMRSLRSFYNPKTIGITGSIGKTTTTEMVYNVLKSKYNTHRSTSSANNYRLAGYFVQAIEPKHEVYVQEIMEGPPYGAAATISKMVQPDAAIVTVVGSSHMEAFGSKERILETCLGIQEGMPENGLLILNGDDPYQKNAVCEKKALYYGIDDETADYRAVNIKTGDTYTTFDIIHEGETTHIVLYCFGRHNVLDALAAFAAGKWAGMTNEEISSALSKYRTSGIRQNLVKFGGYRIFLDCYNAAVESMKTALEQLGEIPVAVGGKRIAVLADIKESGDMTVDYHKQVGTIAAASCADIVICYGDNARYIAEEAQKSKKTYYTNSRNELMKIIKENVTTDDVTLFKGSHGMKLEQIVDNIWGTWFHEEYEVYEYRTKKTSDNDLSYRIYTDHVSVTNKISTKSDIAIPDFVEKVPVRSISPSAFSGSRSIRHIKFPENLVNIRYCAFYNSMLEGEIVIPSSVRIIHDSAFGHSKLQQVIINDGCTHLGYRAFGNCTKLKSIRIPKTVLQIGNEAFINCKQLTIYGKAGSYAEAYAVKNEIKFIIENPEKNDASVV